MPSNKQLAKKESDPVQDNVLPEEFAEVLQKVDPQTRGQIERIMVSQFSMVSRLSPETEVMKKVTPEHITAMISTQDEAMKRTFKENSEKRWFSIGLAAMLCGMFVFVILALKDTPDVMEKIIYAVGGVIVGGFGGYGIGRTKNND